MSSPPASSSTTSTSTFPIRPVGLEENGQLEIPDETEVGWYRYGGVPGRPGATVLAGHVTWNRTTGPFWLLRDLEPGARIDVELADGSVRSYEAGGAGGVREGRTAPRSHLAQHG